VGERVKRMRSLGKGQLKIPLKIPRQIKKGPLD
jgi:hypothetical protein